MSDKPVSLAGGEKTKPIFYIHLVFGFFMMFVFGRVVPPFATVTAMGMQVVGIFIGLIWLWTTAGMLWPSLIGIIALTLSDFASFNQVIATGFGNNVAVLMLFVMILFGAPQAAGVTQYIARWFLTRKIINGKPVIFSFIIMYCAYVMALVAFIPAIIFMWAVLYGALKEVGYKPSDKYSTIMVIGVFFGALSGQAAFPFRGTPMMILAVFETASGTSVPVLPYIIAGFIMSSLGIALYSLLIKFVFRPDMSKLANVNTEMFDRNKLPPMNTKQKILSIFMISFLLLAVAPTLLPDTWLLTMILNEITTAGLALMLVSILCIIRTDGKPIINFKEAVTNFVNWEVYILVVMVSAISAALVAPGAGITEFIVQAFRPVLSGHSSVVFSAIIMTINAVLTNFANTVVIGMILMPALVTYGAESGLHLTASVAVMVFIVHYALLTPAASPFAAMLWGNKEWVKPIDILKYGFVISIGILILFILIAVPIATSVFTLFGY